MEAYSWSVGEGEFRDRLEGIVGMAVIGAGELAKL